MGCQNRGLSYRVPHESHGIVLDEDFFLRSHVVPSEFDYFFHQSQPKVADERFVCSLTQSQPTLNTQGRMGLLLEVFAVLQSFLTNLKACLASCLAIYLIGFVYVSHMYVGHVKFRRVPFDHFSYLRIWNNFYQNIKLTETLKEQENVSRPYLLITAWVEHSFNGSH